MFTVKIDMLHNAGFTHSFEWVDKDGVPISLAGQTLKMQIKRKTSDLAAIYELSTANGRIVIDPDQTNRFTIDIAANVLATTFSLDKSGIEIDKPYAFDLLRIISAEERPALLRGTISVRQGATQ